MDSSKTRLIAAASAAAVLAALTACSSATSTTGGGTTSSSAATGTTSASASAAASVSASASASGPTGTPVKVGLLNPSGGPVPVPTVATGAEAAVKYINSELGGIGGRPLQLVSCATDTTPESVQGCANTFVSDGVVAVFDGYNVASSAALPTLTGAGIPLVGMIPFDSVTGAKAAGRVYFAAPQASFLIGALQAFKAEGKKSVTLALVDTPAAHQTIDGLLPVLSKVLGISAKGIYFSPTNPNFTAVAAAIDTGNPDVGGLMASPSEAVCTALVQGLRQLGYHGTIFTAACTQYIKDAPAAQSSGGALYSSNWLPGAKAYAPAGVQSELGIAAKYLGAAPDYYAVGEFALAVNFAKALSAGNTANLTGASVLSTLKALKNFPTFLGPNVTCGSPTSPDCTTQMLLFTVQADGSIKPVTGGWVTPARPIMQQIPGAV
jgi:branched-chain amino acid transport system substrate-binding protein